LIGFAVPMELRDKPGRGQHQDSGGRQRDPNKDVPVDDPYERAQQTRDDEPRAAT
jgi:hypothetical protein